MRLATWVLAAIVAWCALAVAAPKKSPKPGAPTPPADVDAHRELRKQIQDLERQLTPLQVKQAYVAAIKVAKQILDLEEKASGKDSDLAANRKMLLASMYSLSGDYATALKLQQENAALAERVHGPDSREARTALSMEIGSYMAQQRYADAAPIEERLLAMAKKQDGEDSTTYQAQLTMYASFLMVRGEFSASERAYLDLMQLQAKHAPNDPTSGAGSLMALGALYWQMGEQAKAIAAYDKAAKLYEGAKNLPVVSTSSSLASIAMMYHLLGRDDLADPMFKRYLVIVDQEIARLEKDKPDDLMIPILYGTSGSFLFNQNDLANAEARLIKADDINRAHGKPTTYQTLLGMIWLRQGKAKDALSAFQNARADLEKVAPRSASSMDGNIASAYLALGDHKKAIELYEKQLAGLEKTWGRKNPLYGKLEFGVVYPLAAVGETARAEHVLADSLELAEHELQTVLRIGNESDHVAWFRQNAYYLDNAINFHATAAPKSASAARLALTTLLRRKGRALDASAAALATLRAKLSPEDKALLDELGNARTKLAKLTVAGPDAVGDPVEYGKELAALEDQVQKLEYKLGQRSATYRASAQPIELAAIQQKIPAGSRLVELVNFQPADMRKMYVIGAPLPPRHYAAFITGATGDPSFVDLGEAAEIDDAIGKFRKAVADPDNDRAVELARVLDDLTFAKLEGRLGNATEILLAPDGMLNVVPFAALVDAKGEFRIAKYNFTYLTSGRDLLRLKVKPKAQGGGVIFANPKFDAGTPAGANGSSRGQRSIDLASLSWPPLPGTGQEATAVSAAMHGFTMFTGAQATESAVKAVHSPRILHMATHGFFLPDVPPAPPPAPGDTHGSTALAAAPAGAPAPPGVEDPLLRSGLALAGANQLSSGDEDGILTALEASGLDLEGTKLVVLSACETGVGKATNGDGVYGLRRALVVAGAESLVMSMWQVDDQATKDLMVGYYKRLAAGKPRSSALRDIQLELKGQPKYKHPYYWASFLPAGDNTPLN